MKQFLVHKTKSPGKLRKEVALCMYLVESGTPLYATQHNSFKTMLHEFGIELSSRQTLESTVLPAIFLAVYRDLQTHLKIADIVSVSFDG